MKAFKEKCENKKIKLIYSRRPGSGREGRPILR